MNELPLVFFTVLSQLAVGALITIWLLDMTKRDITISTGKFIIGSLVVISSLGVLISLLHLGHPLHAYRALTHFETSWLSREVIFFSLFIMAEVIYFFYWKAGEEKIRKFTGAIVSLLGIIAVFSSSMVYVISAMPAWNNFSPILFFFMTASVLGPLYVSILIKLKDKKILFNLPVLLSIIIGLYMLAYFLYLSVLVSGDGTQNATGLKMMSSNFFWIRLVLSWILPLVWFASVIYRKQTYKLNDLIIVFFLIFIGELLGREVFYSTITGLGINSIL